MDQIVAKPSEKITHLFLSHRKLITFKSGKYNPDGDKMDSDSALSCNDSASFFGNCFLNFKAVLKISIT